MIFGIGALLLSSCASKEKENQEAEQVADLTEEYQEATNFNDSLLLLMGDIYTGLDSINSQEKLLYAPGQGDNANRREEIRQNLTAIKARLNANRQIIDNMEAKLKASGNQNAVLTKTIERLKANIANQEKQIKELQAQLEQANKQIGDLTNQVAETQEQVKTETEAKEQAQQEATAANNELNTVYYAIGTNKELKNQQLLSKKFLSQTKVLKEGFNASYFTKADKRNLSTIPTNGKKVKIWTNMPKDSYQIIKEANGTETIKITNASKFWSMSPYLVIQIDK